MTDGIQSPHNFTISTLQQKPIFFDAMADRIWRAWWEPKGHTAESVANGLRKALDASPIYFALVAHQEEAYMGSALVIGSDMDERPQYMPWVAAVWVDPRFRTQGVGAALIEQAARNAFTLGVDKIYLCASRERRGFYLKRGWEQIEEDVGSSKLTIMTRNAHTL